MLCGYQRASKTAHALVGFTQMSIEGISTWERAPNSLNGERQAEQIGKSLPLVRRRERVEFPGNAIGIREADVLVMRLWILLHPMVADPYGI